MTGMPEHNVPAFNRAARQLRSLGYEVVNPAELDAIEACSTWNEFLRRDLKWLVGCDAIATLPGWRKSKGAKLEVHVGRELSFKIHPVSHYLQRRKNAI